MTVLIAFRSDMAKKYIKGGDKLRLQLKKKHYLINCVQINPADDFVSVLLVCRQQREGLQVYM